MFSKTIRISFLAKPAGNNAQIQYLVLFFSQGRNNPHLLYEASYQLSIYSVKFYMSAHKNTFGERSTKGVPYLIIF